MGIKVCPSLLLEGYDTYSPEAIECLFNGKNVSPHVDMDFEKDFYTPTVGDTICRTAITGVQEKLTAVIADGHITFAAKVVQGTHILKPAPFDNCLIARKQVPANEHLTMQIGRQVYGIPTAENGLCFDRKGRPVYITKRFNILEDGSKARVEDFASILERSESLNGPYFKYEASYEEIALAIKRIIPSWQEALEDFFRRLVFNYIFANSDAHLKNFSIINTGNGYQLSPAYDLINVSLHLNGDDFGLNGCLFLSDWKSEVYERKGHPCRTDFEHFGLKIGLTKDQVEKIVNGFLKLPNKVVDLIERSFLDKKMKRKYLAIVKERLRRFKRLSDD